MEKDDFYLYIILLNDVWKVGFFIYVLKIFACGKKAV